LPIFLLAAGALAGAAVGGAAGYAAAGLAGAGLGIGVGALTGFGLAGAAYALSRPGYYLPLPFPYWGAYYLPNWFAYPRFGPVYYTA